MVLGASGAVGRATVGALRARGIEVAEARAEPESIARTLNALQPTLVVLAAGVTPHLAPLGEQSWDTFSAPWQLDTRAAFEVVRAALAGAVPRGGVVALVSSGAAERGSPRSGGYAGAKRMQWWLAEYAQREADARGLGLRFVTVVPQQFIEGTRIGAAAASAYGGWPKVPLTAGAVAEAVVRALQHRAVVRVGANGVEVTS